jgi:hypothetical protein
MMDGWFSRNFRCSKEAFNVIVARVEERWTEVHPELFRNAHFSIRDRVAVTMHYLTHADGLADSGHIFGISLSRSHVYV